MIEGLSGFFSSPSNRELVVTQLVEHVYLSLVPLLIGIILALPLGELVRRRRWLRGAVQTGGNIVYTVPSLALFVLIPGILGTPLLSPVNVILALGAYTAALLLRPVLDALDAVPGHVTAAATAMGYRPWRRFLTVELPLAVPALAAGVRMASVSNISLVSVGALIGIGGLGRMFTDGYQRDYPAQILVGIALTLLLALVIDLLLVRLWRLLTPWARAGEGVAA